jgi:cyanate permease
MLGVFGSDSALPDKPPVSGKQEFRYGWTVIVGAMICYACSVAAVPTYLNGAFITELQKEFGWSRTLISLGGTVQLLTLAVMSPLIGFVTDRIGIRIPIAISLFSVAAVYVGLGLLLNSYGTYIFFHILMSVVGVAALPVVFTRAINSWFDRSRGLALGITLVGTGLTATFGPSYVTALIAEHGWRGGYLGIAVAIAVASPLVIWLVRISPWETQSNNRFSAAKDTRPTFDIAIRQRLFWALAATFFLQALAILGIVGHLMPLLEDRGVERAAAAKVMGIVGIAVIAGRFFVGAAIDRIFAPWVAGTVVLFACLGCIGLVWGNADFAPLAAFAVGFALGAEVDIIGFLTSRYYATVAYTRLYGLLFAAFIVGAALSPFWIGTMYDAKGHYGQAMLISAGLLLAAAGILFSLPRYSNVDVQNQTTPE